MRTRTARGRFLRSPCGPQSSLHSRETRARYEISDCRVQISDWDAVMKPITRRAALEMFVAAPAAAALLWTPAEARQAHEHAEAAKAAAPAAPFKPKFFTAHEYATVIVLVDLIIPRDERSGSATDAGVPAFMDFMMIDQPRRQVAMRGGLALVDRLAVDG